MRVLGQGLDILHDEAAAHALSVHDIVIMNTEANLQHVAAHVARLGKKMISIAAGAVCNEALDKLASSADATGALLVSETGLAPGLMTVLAKELVRCGARGELHIVLTLDLIGRHGQEAIAWTLAQLRAATGFIRDPRGNKLYPVDFADNSAIAARLGMDTASAYLALRPDLPAIDIASIARHMKGREGGLEALSAATATIVRFFGLPTDRVRLDVTISNDSAVRKAVFQGRDQSNLTGAIAARATEIALDCPLTGSKRMDDLLAFSDADALLSSLGAVLGSRASRRAPSNASAASIHTSVIAMIASLRKRGIDLSVSRISLRVEPLASGDEVGEHRPDLIQQPLRRSARRVRHVGCRRVLGTGAGPQQPLRPIPARASLCQRGEASRSR
ncbi:MAG: hypothetical protein ABIR55_12275 [Burkholderiaceae bacterium]